MKINKKLTTSLDRSKATRALHHAYLQFLGVLVNRPSVEIAAEFYARLHAEPAMVRVSSRSNQHLN